MCTSSYKAPKVAPTPPAPPAPTEGAQAPLINDGSPGGSLAKLMNLAGSANSLVVPFKGIAPPSVEELQKQIEVLKAPVPNTVAAAGMTRYSPIRRPAARVGA